MARRLVEGSLDRAVDVAATLELRGHSLVCDPRADGSAPATTPRCSRRAPRSCSLPRSPGSPGPAASRPTRGIEMASGAITIGLCVALIGARGSPVRAAEVAVAWLTSRLRDERAHLPLPRRRPRRPPGDRPAGGARRVRRPRGPLRLRQVDAAARRLRAGAALSRRAGRGRAGGGRNGGALARTRGARRGGRAGRPGARDTGGQHDGPGRDRAAARASRRLAGRQVAGRRGGVPGARDRRAAGSDHGHALRRRAAAGRAGGGPRHPAAPGAARRAHLSARPGGRRRADLAAATAERGVGGGRAARRASPGALPGGRRPGARPRAARSPSTAPRGLPELGSRPRSRPGDARRAAARRVSGCPAPASVREARRTLQRGGSSELAPSEPPAESEHRPRAPQRSRRWHSGTSGWSWARARSAPRRSGASSSRSTPASGWP